LRRKAHEVLKVRHSFTLSPRESAGVRGRKRDDLARVPDQQLF
jgi:hypothetical protein